MSLNKGRPLFTPVGKAIAHAVKRSVTASTGDLSKRATAASDGQLVKSMIDLSLENTGKKKSKKQKKRDKEKKAVEVATTVKAGDKMLELIYKANQQQKAKAQQFKCHIGKLSATRNDVATKFVDDLFGPVIKNFRIFLVQEGKPWLSKEEYERLCKKD
ncbi:hypothetical protein TRICI_005392 [Trichomonascus ciferrii]|uniref:Uncharacterized protein n=1 Tax=Trichomonascus ciferrii TaxID=44093 RepID=A0A642UUL4_9ASCO|nr:hypothetical protein TRICI_005392 [Trichomonascus ciferrii]